MRMLAVLASCAWVTSAEAAPITRRDAPVSSAFAPVERAETRRRKLLTYPKVPKVPDCAATSHELVDPANKRIRVLHVHCGDLLFERGKDTLAEGKQAKLIDRQLRELLEPFTSSDTVIVFGAVDRHRFNNNTPIAPASDGVTPAIPAPDEDAALDWQRNRNLSLLRARYILNMVPAGVVSRHAIGLGESYVAACEKAGRCRTVAEQKQARRIDIFVLQKLPPDTTPVRCGDVGALACLEDAAATRILEIHAARTREAPQKLSCWYGDYEGAVAAASALVGFAIDQLDLADRAELCDPNWRAK